MRKRRSAYRIAPAPIDLSAAEKRQAVLWWQRGEDYHPLLCPICGRELSLAARGVALECPTRWCSYSTDEIPWAVFVAYSRKGELKESG